MKWFLFLSIAAFLVMVAGIEHYEMSHTVELLMAYLLGGVVTFGLTMPSKVKP